MTTSTSNYAHGQRSATQHDLAANAFMKAIESGIGDHADKAIKYGLVAAANDLAFKPGKEGDLQSMGFAHSNRCIELQARRQDKVLSKYRAGYENSTTANGHKSKCNGDEVARVLEGQTPEMVMQLAEQLLDLGIGELVAKYAKLNKGQQRMNAGNRIRNAVKKRLFTPTDIALTISVIIEEDELEA